MKTKGIVKYFDGGQLKYSGRLLINDELEARSARNAAEYMSKDKRKIFIIWGRL